MMEDRIISEIEAISSEMLQGIKKICQMPSVEKEAEEGAPFGTDIASTLESTLELARSLGFETVNLNHYIGWAQYGSGKDYIGVIGHLDVVPVGTGWKHPPFSAYEENGYIYARGILDNKGPILSCLYALYALKRLELPLKHPVRILFGCDEESGFEDLEYYLKHEKPPIMGWTPDCKYPVVYGERGRAVIEIEAPVQKIDAFFTFVNQYFMNAKPTGDRLGLDYTDPEFGTNEMRNYHMVRRNDHLIFQVSFAYPAGMTLDQIMSTIQQKAPEFRVRCVSHYAPVKFDKTHPMVKALQKAYETITHEDGTPVTTTGGTYAKRMPNIVPFGPSFPGQKGIGHQPNEWMKVDDLITNAKIYALALYYLGNM